LKLEIEGASKIQHLLPLLRGFSLFKNSWFNSVVIDISDLSTLFGWRWMPLADIIVTSQEGLEFNAVRSKLLYLHSDFGKVAKGKVSAIRILKCQLRWLGKEVFAPLHSLKTLELRDNFLEKIERSQLPTRAPNLRTLDLGNNKLRTLPEDFVDGLNLKSILLKGNNLIIPKYQAQIIFNTKGYPILSGVLWPCICDEASKIFGKSFKDQNCYMEDDTNKIFNYQKICSM